MDEDLNVPFISNMVQATVIDANCRYDKPTCVSDSQAVFAEWMALPNPDDLTKNPVNKHAR